MCTIERTPFVNGRVWEGLLLRTLCVQSTSQETCHKGGLFCLGDGAEDTAYFHWVWVVLFYM